MPRRKDAELLKTSKFRELEFHIMRGRNESVLFYETHIDLENTNKFLEKYNKDKKEEEKLTLFQIFLAACVRTMTYRYKVNRFVSGRRLWQRNRLHFNFVVNKEKTEESEEVNATVEFDPFDNLADVQRRVHEKIYEARHAENPNQEDVDFFGGLPRWLIKLIFDGIRWLDERNIYFHGLLKDNPLWCSLFIAHLGSIGIKSVYHHLFEMGNASMLITIGKIHKKQILNEETDEISIRKVMDLKVSIDDRIASGIYTGPTIEMLVDLVENPEPLLEKPKLTDEQLDKLMLAKYKKERLAREKARKKAQKKAKKKK
ncbi:MAG: 2-oxo acid dehydrogenase subunit E2 [Candidatus Heimdallarchaeota archaeon]